MIIYSVNCQRGFMPWFWHEWKPLLRIFISEDADLMSVSDGELTIVWTAKVTMEELFCVPQSSFFLSDYFNISPA